jgi:hypothetical protein
MLDLKIGKGIKVNEVYLIDSTGNHVINYWSSSSVKFDTASRSTNQYFKFAMNYRIALFHWRKETAPYRLLIYYVQYKQKKQTEIIIPPVHIHILCTNNEKLWTGKVAPMEVNLH